MIPTLKIEHARDFCLAHIEIWCKGESTDSRRWTEKKHIYVPYILFEKTDETVNCYMDERGFEWVISELKEQIKKDPQFVKNLAKEYVDIYGNVNHVLEKNESLSHEELIKFLKDYHSGWPIYEALYFLTEILPQSSEEFKLAKDSLDLSDKTGDQGDKLMRLSLKRIFPELGELSSFLLNEEIISRNIPTKDELKKRARGYFYADDKLFVGKNREDIGKIFNVKLENNRIDDLTEFGGQVAYSGKTRGIVRKIMSYSRSNEMKEGEILVTAMTTPEFLPALMKCSAFITDEGGIACHAAIVAREMKKPCIVSTKIATKVLKTGDLVEVDADNGIVKIIKKSS